jgi:hypothetical protein
MAGTGSPESPMLPCGGGPAPFSPQNQSQPQSRDVIGVHRSSTLVVVVPSPIPAVSAYAPEQASYDAFLADRFQECAQVVIRRQPEFVHNERLDATQGIALLQGHGCHLPGFPFHAGPVFVEVRAENIDVGIGNEDLPLDAAPFHHEVVGASDLMKAARSRHQSWITSVQSSYFIPRSPA